ncbi:MAG: YetF domain-containing protein [Pseudomonadota bacterium]
MDWSAPFFDGWQSVYAALVSALIMYPVLIAAIRLNGKRSVSKMNNFDWIVTVAIGSIIASCIGFDSVTVLDATLAIAVLLLMQRQLTGWMARSTAVESVIVASPTVLLLKGAFQHDAMRCERISEAEILSAIRQSGLSGPEDCYAVVMESNANMSVIAANAAREGGAALSALRTEEG